MSTLREKILAASSTRRERVDLPEWGVSVFVHSLTGKQLAEWSLATESRPETATGAAERNADLIVRCTRDEAGAAVFQQDDIDKLTEADAGPLFRLLRVAQRLNGMTKAAEDATAKKSETLSGDSGSA